MEFPYMREREFRRRLLFEDFSDDELYKICRMTRPVVQELCDLLEPSLSRETGRSAAIPVETQLLTALEFFGTGSFQWTVGGALGVSQPTASRIIESVSTEMCQLADRFIRFSRAQQDIHREKLAFAEIAGFPNVIGCIDGTHIAIKAPTEDEPAYVNRKGWHSINVQIVCDSKMKIIDLVARWPGSTHDAFIWHTSGLKNMFEMGIIQDAWLLGDSGYPLEPWIMTPISNPTSPAEEAYNKNHACTRNIVERCIGLKKGRFRCLDKSGGTLLYSPAKVCKIVTAVAVLHNFCIDHRLPIIEEVEAFQQDAAVQPHHNNPPDGDIRGRTAQLRRLIVANMF